MSEPAKAAEKKKERRTASHASEVTRPGFFVKLVLMMLIDALGIYGMFTAYLVKSWSVLAVLAVLLLAVGVVAAGHRQLLAHCFDPADPAAARGASRDERIILGLILAAVTVAIPAVGTILSIALIAAPAAALAPLVRSSRAFLIGCPLLGAALGIAGLAIAVPARLSAGGTIALLCAACVLASRVPARIRSRGIGTARGAGAGNR